jgi:hypothetical protein
MLELPENRSCEADLIGDYCTQAVLPFGAPVFTAGDSSDSFCVLLEGTVGVAAPAGTHKRRMHRAPSLDLESAGRYVQLLEVVRVYTVELSSFKSLYDCNISRTLWSEQYVTRCVACCVINVRTLHLLLLSLLLRILLPVIATIVVVTTTAITATTTTTSCCCNSDKL